MFVFQVNSAEEMRSEVIALIRNTIQAENRILANSTTKLARTVSEGRINTLSFLSDAIAKAKIEPKALQNLE